MKEALEFLKGKPKLISKRGSLKSLNASVYRSGNLAVKVRPGKSLESAKNYHDYQIMVRKELNFLPEYFGTIIAPVKNDKDFRPSIISFFEWIEPLAFNSLKDFQGAYKLIVKAYQKGYFLDPLPRNFGKKGNEIIYLDDMGIGKRPYHFLLPQDSIDHFKEYFQKFKRRLNKMDEKKKKKKKGEFEKRKPRVVQPKKPAKKK